MKEFKISSPSSSICIGKVSVSGASLSEGPFKFLKKLYKSSRTISGSCFLLSMLLKFSNIL